MKILITGGAGFIGSHLADRLLSEGHDVLVVDNYTTGRRDNLTPHANLRVFEGSIADKDLVDLAFEYFKPEYIVHAAASYKDPTNWLEDSLTNVAGTINVVKASQRHNVKRLIYFQTSLCYGLKPLQQPIQPDHPYFASTYSGGSSYAISKIGAELYIELSGLDFISFRLANVYGPRNVSGPLPTFYQRLTNNKPCFVADTRRDFIFIDNIVEVVVKALNGKGQKGYYNISTGSDYAIKELFDDVVVALGITLGHEVEVKPRTEDDTFTILIDNTKTRRDFDWEPKGTLKEGIAKTIEWYKTHTIENTYTHLKKMD